MKRSMVFLFVVSSVCTILHARIWPQLALGGGYECIVIITNKSTRFFQPVSLSLMQGNGEPWSGEWTVNGEDGTNSDSYDIPPLGTMKLRLAGDSVLRAGYLQVGGGFVDLFAIQFFYEYRQDGELIDVTNTPEGKFANRFIFPVERTPTANTGFAWVAPPGESARIISMEPLDADEPIEFPIALTLLDENGSPQESPQTILYDGHLARFFDEVFTDVGTNFVGSVLIESFLPIVLTVLRQETADEGFQLTSVPVDTDFGFPQICIDISFPGPLIPNP